MGIHRVGVDLWSPPPTWCAATIVRGEGPQASGDPSRVPRGRAIPRWLAGLDRRRCRDMKMGWLLLTIILGAIGALALVRVLERAVTGAWTGQVGVQLVI